MSSQLCIILFSLPYENLNTNSNKMYLDKKTKQLANFKTKFYINHSNTGLAVKLYILSIKEPFVRFPSFTID